MKVTFNTLPRLDALIRDPTMGNTAAAGILSILLWFGAQAFLEHLVPPGPFQNVAVWLGLVLVGIGTWRLAAGHEGGRADFALLSAFVWLVICALAAAWYIVALLGFGFYLWLKGTLGA